MDVEMTLFEIGESYSLVGLKDLCLRETKQKFPKPVDGEDWDEYLEFVQQESDLLFAQRLKDIASNIEKRILEPQSKIIKETYKGVFK